METETKPQAKEWTKPELLVLVRSSPEEAVLLNCKTGDLPPPNDTGPGASNGNCTIHPTCAAQCNAQGPS